MAQKLVLITTANGMFGSALVRELAGDPGVRVRAMVRDRSRFDLAARNVDVVVGDLDRPESLVPLLDGLSHVFVTSPMDDRIAARETAVIDAVQDASPAHVLKLYGAVDHAGDALAQQHAKVVQRLRSSSLSWTLISPTSVLETSLLPYAQLVAWNALVGMSGGGRVGFVALSDVARVAAEVIRSGDFDGQDLQITGPVAVSLKDVADDMSEVLGRAVRYYDLPEDDFAQMLLAEGGYPSREALEIAVLCHMRAWRDGRAELVTDTVEQVTGRPPQTVPDWVAAHRASFQAQDDVAGQAAAAELARELAPYLVR